MEMEAIFNRCWVFRGEKCGIYKPKLGIYTPSVIRTGTLVHSLGSMNLSPMIPEITSNPPNRPIWFVDDPLWFADTSFCISNTQQLLKITSNSALFFQNPCTIQINALPLHHKNPPSLSTMLKSAGRFIFIPRVMGTGTLVHSLGSMNLSPMI